MKNNEKKRKPPKVKFIYLSVGLAIGTCIGVAVGYVAIGMCIGLALGIMMDLLLVNIKNRKSSNS